MNKRSIRNYFRKLRLKRYNNIHGNNYKFAGFEISIPSDASFNIKYSLIRGRYEASERKLINKYLVSKSNVIELGGSLGIISKLINAKLETDSTFVVVEANPDIIKFCKKNIYFERRRHSTFIENYAIAYGLDNVDFHVSDDVSCSRIADTGLKGNIQVQACSLSHVVKTHLSNNDFVLIMDIEGGEVDVFKNEKDILQKCSLAIVELHSEIISNYGYTLNDILILINEIGLRLIDQDGSVYVFKRD
tara:strand:+ start:65 stop:805 length:741 start_codon:yes stop_codon:yes gene_type:complete